MEIRLLGPLEVAADGRPLELGGGRQRALLVVLALRPDEVVSTDALIDALWGEAPPPTALKALQGLVSQLRLLQRKSPRDALSVALDLEIRILEAAGWAHDDAAKQAASKSKAGLFFSKFIDLKPVSGLAWLASGEKPLNDSREAMQMQ